MNNNTSFITLEMDEMDKGLPQDNRPHNGKPIGMMEFSPNGKYLVTYSEEEKTIVGWNVEFIEEGDEPVKHDNLVKVESVGKNGILHLCVSDEKILAYIYKISDEYKISK